MGSGGANPPTGLPYWPLNSTKKKASSAWRPSFIYRKARDKQARRSRGSQKRVPGVGFLGRSLRRSLSAEITPRVFGSLVSDDALLNVIGAGHVKKYTCGGEVLPPSVITSAYPAFYRSSLNGSHGEWTESDDVERRKRGGGGPSTKQSRRRPAAATIRPVKSNGKRIRPKKVMKRVAREMGINVASSFVGEDLARYGYQTIARSMRPKKLVLSVHASRYLLSFTKPFDNSVQQVFIPRPPATRSFKVTGFVRGAGVIGLKGVGFVAITPTLANDEPAVFYSTASYNHAVLGAPMSDFAIGSPTYMNGNANTPAAVFMSNLPYSTAALTSVGSTGIVNEISGRIVSCSMRVYYTGTTFNEGGSYYAYADPDLNNVLGGNHTSAASPTGMSLPDLLSKDATEIVKVTKTSEATLIRLSVDPNMDDYPRTNNSLLRKLYPYSNGEYYTNGSNTDVGCSTAVIAIDGTAGQPFYFEMVTHAEYIGPGIVQGLLSDVSNDAVGYDAVKNLLQHAQREVASNPRLTFRQSLNSEMRRQGIVMGSGPRSVDY